MTDDRPASPPPDVDRDNNVSTGRVAHHFTSAGQQFSSAKMGMWLFLVTEVVMFGGLFCGYAVYRASHPEMFQVGHRFLSTTFGTINTVVLLLSSFTMAWGVRCAQRGQRTGLIVCLLCTLAGGLGFMGVKAIEYHAKFTHGLAPGKYYHPDAAELNHEYFGYPPHATPVDSVATTAAPTETVVDPDTPLERSSIAPAPSGMRGLNADARVRATPDRNLGPYTQAQLDSARPFFGIYFAMTGLHGVHVLVGLGLITWLLVRSVGGHFDSSYYTPVDLIGLYWHIVDFIWIYLFPLLYLIH